MSKKGKSQAMRTLATIQSTLKSAPTVDARAGTFIQEYSDVLLKSLRDDVDYTVREYFKPVRAAAKSFGRSLKSGAHAKHRASKSAAHSR